MLQRLPVAPKYESFTKKRYFVHFGEIGDSPASKFIFLFWYQEISPSSTVPIFLEKFEEIFSTGACIKLPDWPHR